MSDQPSLRDELAQALYASVDAGSYPWSEQPDWRRQEFLGLADAVLASPLIARLQAEAFDEGVADVQAHGPVMPGDDDPNPYRRQEPSA